MLVLLKPLNILPTLNLLYGNFARSQTQRNEQID